MTDSELFCTLVAVAGAYLLGSIPTALLVGRRFGIDVRTVGDGNMGARNVARTIGAWPSVIVAVIDVLKGTAAILLARWLGCSQSRVCVAGWAALLGHDFPIFAAFRGGQGLATTIGVLLVLMPVEALIAVGLYGTLYMITHNPDIGAGVGLGTGIFLAAFVTDRPWVMVADAVGMLVSIPGKKWLDRHRVSPRQEQHLA